MVGDPSRYRRLFCIRADFPASLEFYDARGVYLEADNFLASVQSSSDRRHFIWLWQLDEIQPVRMGVLTPRQKTKLTFQTIHLTNSSI